MICNVLRNICRQEAAVGKKHLYIFGERSLYTCQGSCCTSVSYEIQADLNFIRGLTRFTLVSASSTTEFKDMISIHVFWSFCVFSADEI